MFASPYNQRIKDEMMAIDRAYITHSKKVSTKGLLNVSGNKIGGALPLGMSASIGRPIGGANCGCGRSGGARSGGAQSGGARSGGARSGGARSGGKKFKQVGTNIVAKANADLKQHTPVTSATVPPKVGGSTKPKLSAKTEAEVKKEKLKADARILASELAKLKVAEEDPYMDMSGAMGKAPAVNRSTKPKGGAKSGGAKRKPSKWIEHVKAFAAKNGISYRDALRSPECKASYKK
jgi:hypothetical protein